MEGIRRKTGEPLGAYLHLPFCRRLCPYCDYPALEGDPSKHEAYGEVLVREIDERIEAFGGRSLETVHFGGGTPSYAPVSWIERGIRRLQARWPEAAPQIGLEANPEDVDETRLDGWSAAGVDRIVVGVQSFDAETLERLGRLHDPEIGATALRRILADGRFDLGVDLIFGLPGRDRRVWERDLERLDDVAAGLTGLYLYEYRALEGESGSDDGERRASMLRRGREVAAGLGLSRTGVGSFEAPGAEGRHTHGYWTGWEYAGFGMAASTLRIGGPTQPGGEVVRTRNADRLTTYLEDPIESASRRPLEPVEYFADRLALAMRSAKGLDWCEVRRQFEPGLPESTLERGLRLLERFVEAGYVRRDGDRFHPTDHGFDVADAIDREVRRRLLE